jgi:hypothetical protein
METFNSYEQSESNNSKKDREMARVFEESESQLKELQSSMNTEELYDVLQGEDDIGDEDSLFDKYLQDTSDESLLEYASENEYLNAVDDSEN